MSHNPNPFDFVPFATEQPLLLQPEQWLEKGRALTGYIELQIKALTPLHIVGNQEGERGQPKIINSHFYRRYNIPVIPSASIRGALRAFIEAACKGWASQMTPYYEKKFGGHAPHHNPNGRHIGFRAIKDETVASKAPDPLKIDKVLLPALPDRFFPKVEDIGKMDIASFIFGHVPPIGTKEKSEAWRGCIKIDDAVINEKLLQWNDQQGCKFEIPDIQSDAFMGRPWPSASSWWYLFARGLQKRNYQDRDGNTQQTTEFLGQGYRGRKFYFHQSPINCVKWYKEHWSQRLDPFPVECLPVDAASEPFRLYFDELPEQLLNLLIVTITPGNRIRHKIGYGKAYGYGSIEFVICGGEVKKFRFHDQTPFSIHDRQNLIQQSLWDNNKLKILGISEFLHWNSLEKLYQILYFDSSLIQVFSYPPFSRDGFMSPLLPDKMEYFLEKDEWTEFDAGNRVLFSPQRGYDIAKELFKNNKRPALHFKVWQENATGYADIKKRRLEEAI